MLVTGCRIRYFLVTWLLVQLTYNGGDAMGYRHVGCYIHGLGQPSESKPRGAVTVQWCLGFCGGQSPPYRYSGLRRNGGSHAMATCYCVASLSPFMPLASRCGWKCGANLACGGSRRAGGQTTNYVNLYEDIDECRINNGGCNQTCNNSPGSFSCSCEDGYSASGVNCLDIDECRTNNGGCNQTCNNSPGSSFCSCEDGYSAAGAECVVIDECDTNNGGCAQHCTNTPGSYICSCDDGYLANGTECSDIDDCSSYNGGCEHHCINTLGGYHCTCSQGYEANGAQCTDIDECATDNGGCDQECHNTAGSHLCRCRDGYLHEAGVCTDIDECRDSPCEQNCHNVDGGFQCFCEPGWAIMEDNLTCAEALGSRSTTYTTPIWVFIVIGLLVAVVIAMAIVFILWRRHAGRNTTNSASNPSDPLDLHPGSERVVPTSPAAVSRQEGPTDPEESAAPADSQYEQIKIYTNSEAAQGVYEKVA